MPTLKFRYSDGTETMVKLSETADFAKVRARQAEFAGQTGPSIVLTYDGHSIKDGETPQSLEMEEGDFVEVTIEAS